MITAGIIKDTKNNPSRYLDLVRAGKEVVITGRGKAVARIVKEGEESSHPFRFGKADQPGGDHSAYTGHEQTWLKTCGGLRQTDFRNDHGGPSVILYLDTSAAARKEGLASFP